MTTPQKTNKDPHNYSKKIKLLLENALITKQHDFIVEDLEIQITQDSSTSYTKVNSSSDYKFDHRQILAIKALFDQSSKEGRKVIVKELESNLSKKNHQKNILIMKSLAFLGQTEKVIDVTFFRFEDNYQYENLWYFRTITFLLSFKSNLFSNDQLQVMYDWIEDYFGGKNKVGKSMVSFPSIYEQYNLILIDLNNLLNSLLSEILISDIYSVFNPEINIDQKKLADEFKRYDFPEDLSETLDKIDTKITNAKDGFDYKNSMDLLRSFTERLFRSIAIELDHQEGKSINTEDSKVISKFFIKKGLLSESESDLLIGIRHFLSNRASHRLKSPPEECRLIRNILIEYSLYLIERLKEAKSKK